MSNLIVQALKGESLTVYGDGRQTRSFCYVDDLVDAIMRMMSSDSEFTGPVNIGNPGEYSILEAAHIIIAATGSRSKVRHESLPSDDPSRRKPNIDLARSVLGWEPRVPFEEGIRRTIDYFKTSIS